MILKQQSRQLGKIIERRYIAKDGTEQTRTYKHNAVYSDSYVCSSHLGNPLVCQLNSISVKKVMGRLAELLQEIDDAEQEDPKAFYAGFQKDGTTAKLLVLDTKLNKYQRELNEIVTVKSDRLNRGYLNGMVTEEKYPVLSAMLEEEKGKINVQIATVQSEIASVMASAMGAEKIRGFIEEFRQYKELLLKPVLLWQDDEPRKVRRSLASHFERIEVKVIKETADNPRGFEMNYELKI